MASHNAVDNRNVLSSDVVDHNFSHFCSLISIPQEKKIASLERGLHGTAQDDNNR